VDQKPGGRPHGDEVGSDRNAIDFSRLEDHPIAPMNFVSYESPVGDSVHANTRVSVPRDPRDDGFAPDAVAAPSPTENGPELCDGEAGKPEDNRRNEVCGKPGVQGTSREDESDVSEAGDANARAENGVDKGDPSSLHPFPPSQAMSQVESSLRVLRMLKEGPDASAHHEARANMGMNGLPLVNEIWFANPMPTRCGLRQSF